MRIAIIQFPGSNCERETILAVKRAGMQPEEFLWNGPKEKLTTFDGFIIVGGFSYEDRSRSGAIAALDPVMRIIQQQSDLGKPVLGICNGAQILVETGLVPGLSGNKIGLALTENKRVRNDQVLGVGYYNAWINMRLSDDYQYNAFTRTLTPKDILYVPVAHGEGRFVIPPGLLEEIKVHGLNVFQYCDAKGNIVDEFPVNPNGSINNIAAISNKAGNVMAMMPHPERTPNGDKIFHSMREYIANRKVEQVAPLHYQARPAIIAKYQPKQKTRELIVDLIITDNHAMSVENALRKIEIPVKIKRRIHWEIACDSDEIYQKIISSGILFNDRKESVVSIEEVKQPHETAFLVRPKEDMLGLQKKQMLEHHFNVYGVHSIHHGVLWNVIAREEHDHVVEHVINSHILFNPYAHDCYYY